MVLPAFGIIQRDAARVRAQADLRLQGDRGLDDPDRLPRPADVDPPHVHDADCRSSC